MNNKKLMVDLTYGLKNENKIQNILEKYFNVKLTKTEQFDEFDYINKEQKILIELKSRRNTKTKYYDTMIGYNKVITGLKKIKEENYKVYFCFNFTDYLCYFELTLNNELNVRNGGRKDRGYSEIKKYTYIPYTILKNIHHNKTNNFKCLIKL